MRKKSLGGPNWTHWVDVAGCTQWKRALAPNAFKSFHWVQAIRRTQCNESIPLGALTSRVVGVRAVLVAVLVPCFPNVRSRLRQPCSLGSLGDLRVPRPLGVCIYAFGSRSSATRRKLPTVRSACGLNRDRVWHPGGVGRFVRVSALGPGRRSRRSRSLLRQSAALCVVASLRG